MNRRDNIAADNFIGNEEVDSSILSGSTIRMPGVTDEPTKVSNYLDPLVNVDILPQRTGGNFVVR